MMKLPTQSHGARPRQAAHLGTDRPQAVIRTAPRRPQRCAAHASAVATAPGSVIAQQQRGAEAACLALMHSVVEGHMRPEDAARQMASLATSPQHQKLVAERARTPGPAQHQPKIVQGQGKCADQLAEEFRELLPLQASVLATRVSGDAAESLLEAFPEASYNPRSHTLCLRSEFSRRKPERQPGAVCVVSGSAADEGVAEECKLVAEHMGCYAFQLRELQVSAMERMLSNLGALRSADVVIVAAGADGALAAVLAGLVDAPVVAIPTSSGGPRSSNVCLGSSVSVVNTDDGQSAAFLAARILRQAAKLCNVRLAALASQQATALGASNGSAGPVSNCVPFANGAPHQPSAVPMPVHIGEANGKTVHTGEANGKAHHHMHAADAPEPEVVPMGPRCAWPATKAKAPVAVVANGNASAAYSSALEPPPTQAAVEMGPRCAWPASKAKSLAAQ